MINGTSRGLACSAAILLCRAVCLALAAALSAFAADTYYRWTDADGNPVISDRPPAAGIPYDTVTERSPRPGAPAPGAEGSERNGAASKPAVARPAVRNPATCELARNNLHALQSSDAVRSLDSEGNYYFLSDEQKQMQIERAEALIRVHCMPADATPEAQ